MQIILASQNKNKLKELSTIFQINSSKHSLVSPSEVLNVIEDKETIKENAEKKALEYFEFYDLPVIADDSGLFVDALNGAPGVHSARFSGENANDEKNNDKLLDLLQNNSNRSATFKTVLCFYDGKDFNHDRRRFDDLYQRVALPIEKGGMALNNAVYVSEELVFINEFGFNKLGEY